MSFLWPRGRLVVFSVAFISCAAAMTTQLPAELDSHARERIEQARASIVEVTVENEDGQVVSTASGFFIRNDLVATDNRVVGPSLRVRARIAGKDDALTVVNRGNYFLPFIEVVKRPDISPLQIATSHKVEVNDRIYMFTKPDGPLSAGIVTSTETLNSNPFFSISLPVSSSNRGLPVFNVKGEVIGIGAESPVTTLKSKGIFFHSSLLLRLYQLGEPGGGVGPAIPSLGPGRGEPGFGGTTPGGQGSSATAASVDTKPVLLTRVAPRYTEEARANNIQGEVTLRALVGEDGAVHNVRIVRGLPDGLNEQAIAAARQAKFKPAMKDGKPVAYWVVLQLEFNLR